MRRCYVDCTDTVYTGLNTGIQRVVRNIISRCSAVRVGEIEFVPVFAAHGKFYRYEDTTKDPLVVSKALINLLGGIRNAVDRLFDAVAQKQEAENGPNSHDASSTASRLYAQTVLRSRKLVPSILKIAFLIDHVLSSIKPVRFERGDILFLADVFWNTVLMDAIRRDPHAEAIHFILICDILPVTCPQFFPKENVDGFCEHLPTVFRWADGIISISGSALDEIRAYGAREGYSPLYEYFHLGADFKDEKPDPARVRTHLRDIFEGDAPFLMVGTIEPRKNYPYVLETFRHLWEQGADDRLCIVGRIGWKCRETVEAIRNSPQYGKKLFLVNDATDAELTYCYSHARAIIIASMAEGFGLPLVEALHFGKKVFASDIPVFREIGKDLPVYFALDRPAALQDLIAAWKNDGGRTGAAAYRVLNWDDSIAALFSKISMMADSIDRRRGLQADDPKARG